MEIACILHPRLIGWCENEGKIMSKRRHLAPWGRKAEALRALEAGGGPPDEQALAALEGRPAIYHCVSRIVWRELALGEAEKEHFVRLLRKWEAFCKVRVLTFCAMTNHFHILVEVPERPAEDPSDEELLDHLRLIHGRAKIEEIRQEVEHWREMELDEKAEEIRQRFLRRMWDLSWFMRQLKQAFTKWFNKRHGKKGHLWEEKFKSMLVEEGKAARVVAGYIDLNPVRAGIAADPADYRWSGWGEAAAGKRQAREGIRQVMLERELGRSNVERALRDVSEWEDVAGAYAALLAEDGGAGNASGGVAQERKFRGRKPAGGARLTEAQLLRRKVRYFVDGMVIGTKGFVEGVFRLSRPWFGSGRKDGARRISGAATDLTTVRTLQVKPMGR